MKKGFLLIILFLFGIFLWSGSAAAYTIDDPHNDAIGQAFESYGMDVGMSGGLLNIDLYTKFDGDLRVYSGHEYWDKFLETGEGLNHIAFHMNMGTDEWDICISKANEVGGKMVCGGKVENGGKWAYMVFEEYGNIVVEFEETEGGK